MNVNLDRRIRVEQRVATKDAYGAPVESWALVASLWAEMVAETPSRSETLRQGAVIAENRTRCRIRWRGGLDSSMRVLWDGVPYNIIGGPAELGRREYLEMMLERYSA